MELTIDPARYMSPDSAAYCAAAITTYVRGKLKDGGWTNQELIWKVFARRGVGFSADQGDPGDRNDQVEAFNIPLECTLGLAENKAGVHVQVYPNPAGMYLMVTAPAGESVVRLLDATGKQVLRSVMTEGVNTIQTAQLMQGQYQVVIIHEQFIRTEKVTIVHE